MESKACTLCGVEKPFDCFAKHRRDGLTSWCKPCHAAKTRAYSAKNKEKVLAATKRWREANPEYQVRASSERRQSPAYKKSKPIWDKKYREKAKISADAVNRFRSYARKWREGNAELAKARVLRWAKNNPAKCRSYVRARQARKLLASPAWADPEKILEIYLFAQEFRDVGFDVHVDHIVPLRGELVSGLHVHNNLRVCLAAHNIRKSNRFDSDTV